MVWSAAIGLAGNVYAANKASQDANRALAEQRRMQDRQLELANTNIAMQLAQDRERREANAYNRRIEEMNRASPQTNAPIRNDSSRNTDRLCSTNARNSVNVKS